MKITKKRNGTSAGSTDAMYQTVFENTGTATIIGEDDTTIYLANTQFQNLCGCSKEQLEGKMKWADFIVPEDLPMMLQYHRNRRVNPDAVPKHYELRFHDCNGVIRDMYITVDLIPGTQKSVLSFMDVTKLKQAEREVRELNEELEKLVKERTAQLEATNKEIESFSYSVSHDLRMPLISIQAFSRLLIEKYASRLDAKGKRFLSAIQKSSKQMDQLINGLLALSKLKKQELKATEIDMGNLARDVFEELKTVNPGRVVKLVVHHPPTGVGDSSMIRQVVVNLLSNAMKFTRKREEAVIEIGGSYDGDETIYYIKDNGVGFNMAEADKLFGVFQRLHSADEYEGTGIGLTIVQRIITRHGGRVWAEAKPDEGATFYFTLPGKCVLK